MPAVYGISSLGTNLTTSGTPNTNVESFFVKPGAARAVFLQSIMLQGKGAGLTAISGIIERIKKWTTASTAGTAITPQPVDPKFAASSATAAYRPTAGSGGGTVVAAFGCGAAGPGGWVAPNQDSMIGLNAGDAGSISGDDASGTASLNFEFSGQIVE